MEAVWMTIIATCFYACLDLVFRRRDYMYTVVRRKLVLTSASIFAAVWGLLVSMRSHDKNVAVQHAVLAGVTYLMIVGGVLKVMPRRRR